MVVVAVDVAHGADSVRCRYFQNATGKFETIWLLPEELLEKSPDKGRRKKKRGGAYYDDNDVETV